MEQEKSHSLPQKKSLTVNNPLTVTSLFEMLADNFAIPTVEGNLGLNIYFI